jgi:hypothetical protein
MSAQSPRSFRRSVQWRAEVEKMRSAFKAPIDPKDVDTIVDYLVSLGQRSKLK